MSMTGFLKLPNVPGESRVVGHEDEIEILGMEWSVARPTDRLAGTGRAVARASVEPIQITKIVDASTPALTLACLRGTMFPEAKLTFRKTTGDVRLDYLSLTLNKVTVSSAQMGLEAGEPTITETIHLRFASFKMLYVEQASDASAGDPHEIEYDIVAGR